MVFGPSTEKQAADDEFERWLSAARDGSGSCLGQALEACRGYMLLVANRELDARLKQKVGASDLVQDAFLEAQRDFEQFRGSTQREFHAWLVQILVNRLRATARHYRGTQKRSIDREVSSAQEVDRITNVVAEDETPSRVLAAWEEDQHLNECLQRLPDDDRQVLILRNWEGKSFAEVGDIMGRSANAARKLWMRAAERLGRELGG
ncbi:MAG: sigma-70 family RNA polymerase sigma factor [Pirellulales bacterium]